MLEEVCGPLGFGFVGVGYEAVLLKVVSFELFPEEDLEKDHT